MTPMNPDNQPTGQDTTVSSDHAQQLADAIDAYFRAHTVGDHTSITDFASRYPQFSEELANCLHNLQFMDKAVREVSADLPPAHMRSIGDYRIVRRLGCGGMGVVYEAQQVSLQRRVALKVLPAAGMLDQRQLARFKVEALAARSTPPHQHRPRLPGRLRPRHPLLRHAIHRRSVALGRYPPTPLSPGHRLCAG